MAAMTLKQALEQDNSAEVRKLIDQKVDVNEKDPKGWTPLHAAVAYGRFDLIKFLLNAGANASINTQSNIGNTPLHITTFHDFFNEDLLQLLFDAGADKSIGVKNNSGATPVHLAASYWINSNTFKCLLQRAESTSVVNEINIYGQTALYLAAYKGNVDFIKLLLQHGAEPSVNVQNEDGYTPFLHVMTRHNEYKPEVFKDIMKILVEAGADVNVRDAKTGRTALHLAAVENDTDMVEFLSFIGADLNAKDNKGLTPLSLSIDCNKNNSHLSVIQMLKLKSFITGADLNRLENEVNRKNAVELEQLSKKFEEYSKNAEVRMSQLMEQLSEEKQARKLEVEKFENLMKKNSQKLNEKFNQDRAVEFTKLEELSKKFEKYSENAEARVSLLKKELSEEKQGRRLEVKKLGETIKNDKNKFCASCGILIICFLIFYQFLIYFFTQ